MESTQKSIKAEESTKKEITSESQESTEISLTTKKEGILNKIQNQVNIGSFTDQRAELFSLVNKNLALTDPDRYPAFFPKKLLFKIITKEEKQKIECYTPPADLNEISETSEEDKPKKPIKEAIQEKSQEMIKIWEALYDSFKDITDPNHQDYMTLRKFQKYRRLITSYGDTDSYKKAIKIIASATLTVFQLFRIKNGIKKNRLHEQPILDKLSFLQLEKFHDIIQEATRLKLMEIEDNSILWFLKGGAYDDANDNDNTSNYALQIFKSDLKKTETFAATLNLLKLLLKPNNILRYIRNISLSIKSLNPYGNTDSQRQALILIIKKLLTFVQDGKIPDLEALKEKNEQYSEAAQLFHQLKLQCKEFDSKILGLFSKTDIIEQWDELENALPVPFQSELSKISSVNSNRKQVTFP